MDLGGAIDCYVHAAPDLLPRARDDLALADECRKTGLRAALHRHHFAATADRAALARNATGFDLLGAIILNEQVGGLQPAVVDMALRSGVRWIGMPTLSAAAFRRRLPSGGGHDAVLRLGPGNLTLIDEAGRLRPPASEILELAGSASVAVGLGYGSMAECMALCRAAAEARAPALVLTYPDVMGLSDPEVRQLIGQEGAWLEVCAFTLHPHGIQPHLAADLRRRTLSWIAEAGPDRVIVSSDGGMAGLPDPAELLHWCLGWLRDSGLQETQVAAMVRDNPARLLRL